ncbi:hypothetical protein MJH12_11980, partial [bacterium]|nr:hypothetical protein [bacterium]
MQIYVNNEELEINTLNLINLSQLIQQVELSTLEPKKIFLTSIKLNDHLLNDQEEEDYGDYPIAKINSLHLYASSPKELVLDGLQLASSILPEMHQLIATILEYFEEGNQSKAYQEFQVITDGLMWFSTIFHGIEDHLSEEIHAKSLHDHPFYKNGQKLSNIFK